MVRRSKKIGLLDHMGGGNLGDDATQTAVIHHIKTRWPTAALFGFSMNPSDTQARHGIPSYAIRREIWNSPPMDARSPARFRSQIRTALTNHALFFSLAAAINAIALRIPKAILSELPFLAKSFRIIRTFDILIISGGGQLLDSWGGPWKYPYTLFKWVMLAKISGVKCYFINVGAGPLRHRLSKHLIKHALHLADSISFRDQQSKVLAETIGFKGEAQVFPDCVYGLDHAFLATHRTGTRGDPIVGFSPMAYCDPRSYYIQDQAVYESFIRKLATFGSWLSSHRHRLKLFSTDIVFDAQTLEELELALRSDAGMIGSQLLARDPIMATEDLLSQMSSFDYIITCRFHGVVFAHLMNIPVLAISHHPKVTTLMSDLGLSEYCLDIHAFEAEELASTFERMVDNKDDIKARMAETVVLYKNTLTRHFDQLFPLEENA